MQKHIIEEEVLWWLTEKHISINEYVQAIATNMDATLGDMVNTNGHKEDLQVA